MDIISPLDSRYANDTKELKKYFTEYQLIKHRYIFELEYFLFLLKKDFKEFPYNKELDILVTNLLNNIDDNELYKSVKEIERNINHDVKSIEYYINNKLRLNRFNKYTNLVHFGLTSQDVNTSAYSIILKKHNRYFIFLVGSIIELLREKREKWSKELIIGKTHGQPATWTKLGKEMNVYIERLSYELDKLFGFRFTTKLGGSLGNLTSHKLLSKKIDWVSELDTFCIEKFDLLRESCTTQIHNYNNYSEYFDIVKRICCTLKDLCVDMWLYISNKNIRLEKPSKHVGSSIMPHKVNPIEFENAEGNLKIAIMWCNFISSELLCSRLQRDLTDSTILRNIGVIFGHIVIAINRLLKGIDYCKVNTIYNERMLRDNMDCMSEIENHILRVENSKEGYDTIKNERIITKSVEEYKKYLL